MSNKNLIERHELEKASLEETVASWMQRALYAEKQNRVLQTKLDAFEGTRPAKKARTHEPEPEGAEGPEDEAEEDEAEEDEAEGPEGSEGLDAGDEGWEADDKPMKKLRVSKKKRLQQACVYANDFRDDHLMKRKESFRCKSSSAYSAYRIWCEHNNIPEVLTHCLFNKHMAKAMPNGYTITRGSGNKAVVNFEYKLAAADLEASKKK